jgi:transposase
VIRTTVTGDDLGAAGVVGAGKNLAGVEKEFRCLKAVDIDLRPVHHHLEHRVRAHVFLWFLAAHLTNHLRKP